MKRYERLLGTYGLTTSFLPKQGVESPGPAQGKRSTGGPSTPTKKRAGGKRKRASLDKDDDAEDDAEDDKAPATMGNEAGSE